MLNKTGMRGTLLKHCKNVIALTIGVPAQPKAG